MIRLPLYIKLYKGFIFKEVIKLSNGGIFNGMFDDSKYQSEKKKIEEIKKNPEMSIKY